MANSSSSTPYDCPRPSAKALVPPCSRPPSLLRPPERDVGGRSALAAAAKKKKKQNKARRNPLPRTAELSLLSVLVLLLLRPHRILEAVHAQTQGRLVFFVTFAN
jgi:hypothetical protein